VLFQWQTQKVSGEPFSTKIEAIGKALGLTKAWLDKLIIGAIAFFCFGKGVGLFVTLYVFIGGIVAAACEWDIFGIIDLAVKVFDYLFLRGEQLPSGQ
jgi:hypothetical protein